MSAINHHQHTFLHSLDLNDLENDLLETTSNFDLESLNAFEQASHHSGESTTTINNIEPTLESILNENDDDDFDSHEFLKSFQASCKSTDTPIHETRYNS